MNHRTIKSIYIDIIKFHHKFKYLGDNRHVTISCNGSKRWYLDGKLHRVNGPATELNSGAKFWYRNGKLHREDGPAVECSGGTKEWWVNGNFIKKE